MLMGVLLAAQRSLTSPGGPAALRTSHYRVLEAVGRGGVRVSDIGERVGVTTQAAGQFVSALVESGHLVQVLDPAEETLPYSGRTEFLSPDGSQRWIADRAESLRDRYRARLLAHRAAIHPERAVHAGQVRRGGEQQDHERHRPHQQRRAAGEGHPPAPAPAEPGADRHGRGADRQEVQHQARALSLIHI